MSHADAAHADDAHEGDDHEASGFADAMLGDDAHGSGHGHEPAGEPLGAVDLGAWLFTIGGALVGLTVVLALYAASNG